MAKETKKREPTGPQIITKPEKGKPKSYTQKETSKIVRQAIAKDRQNREIELPGKDIITDESEQPKKTADRSRIIEEIVSWNFAQRKTFKPIYDRAKENIGLVFDKPWTDEEKTRFITADRVDMNIPTTYSKVLTLLGYEINNREQFEAEPDQDEDDLIAEIYNNIFRHIENADDPAKYDYTKSDIFFDGIIPCFGAHEIYTETNEMGENIIKMKSLAYDEVLFDMNFKEYEQQNCSRIQHSYETYLDELLILHPKKAMEFDKIANDFGTFEAEELKPAVNEFVWNDTLNKNKKIVRVIRDWKRVSKLIYEVHNITKQEITEYDSEEEALKATEDLKAQARADAEAINARITDAKAAAVLMTGGTVNIPIEEITPEEIEEFLNDQFIIKEVPKSLIQYTKIAGTVILEEPRLLEVDEHPVTIYFSLFIRGKFLTVVDVTRDLPRWINKIFAQIDFNLGTDTKNTKVLFTQQLDTENNTVQEAADAISKPGGIIYAKGTAANGSPVQNVQQGNSNAQYAPVLQILMELFDKNYGGQNFQGFQESPNESGIAIKRRQAAAAVVAINYLNNLRRFDELVGKKLVKYIKKFYTHKLVMKVLGENLGDKIIKALEDVYMYKSSGIHDGLGWIIVNDPKNPDSIPISDANLSIVIRKVSARQDEKEIEFEKLKMIKELGYAVPLTAFMDNMNIKATRRQELLEEQQKQEAQQARMAKLQESKALLDANLQIARETKPSVKAEQQSGIPQNGLRGG